MYVIMMQFFTHTMPFTHDDKGFVKIYRTVYMVPNSLDLNPVDTVITLYMKEGLRSGACIALLISSLGDPKDRVRTCCEKLNQQIINKSIDHWRDKLKAVVRLNGGHIEHLFLTIWFICCRALLIVM